LKGDRLAMEVDREVHNGDARLRLIVAIGEAVGVVVKWGSWAGWFYRVLEVSTGVLRVHPAVFVAGSSLEYSEEMTLEFRSRLFSASVIRQ
jgi:hypothetical protein